MFFLCIAGTGIIVRINTVPVSVTLVTVMALALTAFFFTFHRKLISPGLLCIAFYGCFISIIHLGVNGVYAAGYQIIGIGTFYLASITIIRYYKYNTSLILRDYTYIAVIASMLAIFQNIGAILEISYIWDMRWVFVGASEPERVGSLVRATSFFTEPGYFVVLPASAFIYTVVSRNFSLWTSGILFLGVLLSMSTIGIVAIAISILFSFRLRVKSIANFIVIGGMIITAVLLIPSVFIRVSGLFGGLLSGIITGTENYSVFIRMVDFSITLDLLSDYWLTGVGIGAYKSYALAYFDTFYAMQPSLQPLLLALGPDEFGLSDGGSLATRLLVELGIPCTLILIYFFIRGMSRIIAIDRALFALLLCFFSAFALRSGQLIRFDLIFFLTLMIYYLNANKSKSLNLNKGKYLNANKDIEK
jgi:hypothetical protein